MIDEIFSKDVKIGKSVKAGKKSRSKPINSLKPKAKKKAPVPVKKILTYLPGDLVLIDPRAEVKDYLKLHQSRNIVMRVKRELKRVNADYSTSKVYMLEWNEGTIKLGTTVRADELKLVARLQGAEEPTEADDERNMENG